MPPSFTRRSAIAGSLGAIGAAICHRAHAAPALGPGRSIRALACDGFTIFDPRAISAAVSAIFPDSGAVIASDWTAKIFELSWIETAAGRYSGFRALADAALQQVADRRKIAINAASRSKLVATFGNLPLWPDALAVLTTLRQSGIRLVFLSNLAQEDLEANMRRSGLDALMEPPLSTDLVRAFKPSPRAYAMGPDHFRLPAKEIGFAAFGGWDALGAKWFGYPTIWVNRLGSAAETLLPHPDKSGSGLPSVQEMIGAAQAGAG